MDETTGEATTVVQFDTQWRRPAGFNHRDQQWVLLEGSIQIGAEELPAPAYLLMPGGALVPSLTVAAGSRAVVYRESSWYFQETARAQPWSDETFRYERLATTRPATPGAVTVLREHGPDRTFLITAGPTDDPGRWPSGTHSAVLLSGRVTASDRSLIAPLGQFGGLGGTPIPPLAVEPSDHRWFALARTSPDEAGPQDPRR